MKIGVCSSPKHWKEIAEIGYDYAESNLSYLAKITDEEFATVLAFQKDSGICVEACNNFFPPNIRLYAYREDGTEDAETFAQIKQNIEQYVSRALARAEQLGVKIAVLGSSGARTIPENVNREVAQNQFLQILRICGTVAAQYGIIITVEPLNVSETNFINTVAEGADFARLAQMPSIRAMADLYHCAYNKEPPETITGSGDLLTHVHLARFSDRSNPTLANEEEILPYIQVLRKIGYNGRISLECSFQPDFHVGVAESYRLLKQWQA